MRRTIAAVVLAGTPVGCTKTVIVAAPTPSSSAPNISSTPSPVPKPEKAKPVILRGAYNGTCTLLKSSGVTDAPAHETFRWHFQPAGSRILLTSKSGGYTMKLARRTQTKFYGSVNTGGGYQFAYTITASQIADNGVGSKIHVITHDSAIGGTASESYVCNGASA